MTANVHAELEKTYHRRFHADVEYRNAIWRVLVRGFFSRYVRRSDHVLDLGCGYGQFINHVECERRYAMDLNPGSRRLLHDEIVFLEQDCAAPWPLAESSLDVGFTSNFFEHLPDKAHLARTIAEAYRCLRPGRRPIATWPKGKYVGGAYWDFFDHHIALTELSLQEVLELTGFRMREVVGRFLPYTMVNAPQFPRQLVVLYLKMRWLWRWFGRQFLLVAEK